MKRALPVALTSLLAAFTPVRPLRAEAPAWAGSPPSVAQGRAVKTEGRLAPFSVRASRLGTQVLTLWKETPAARIKLRIRGGRILERWSFPRGEARTVTPPPDAAMIVSEQRRFEARLADVKAITRIEPVVGQGDSFSLKLHYGGGFAAQFKADHRKWNAEWETWNGPSRPRRIELAVYRLGCALSSSSGLIFPPVAILHLDPALVRRIMASDPATPASAVAYFDEVLAGTPGLPRAVLDDGTGELVGSAQLWVDGNHEIPLLERPCYRVDLERVAANLGGLHALAAPSTIFRQLGNLLVFDFLVNNNDRAGNLLIDRASDLVRPIDNDGSFPSCTGEPWARQVMELMPAVDHRFIAAVGAFLQVKGDEELEALLFPYGANGALPVRAVNGLRSRFGQLEAWVARRRPAELRTGVAASSSSGVTPAPGGVAPPGGAAPPGDDGGGESPSPTGEGDLDALLYRYMRPRP